MVPSVGSHKNQLMEFFLFNDKGRKKNTVKLCGIRQLSDEAVGVAQAFERGGGCVREGLLSGLQEVEEFGVVALGEEGVVGSCGDATVAGGKRCGGEWAAANLLNGNAEDGF